MDTSIEEYDIDGRLFKVVFLHTPDFTACNVIAFNDKKHHNVIRVGGVAKRHPNEQDNPEMGKRVAMRRALGIGDEFAYFTYGFEHDLWRSYRARRSVKAEEYFKRKLEELETKGEIT